MLKDNKILVRELPWPTGEVAGLTKAEWDNFVVYYPAEDSGFGENIIFFAAGDKKGYETLVGKLQQIILYIKQHNLDCDCP